MALNFPSNPVLNQIYTGPLGQKWKWNGSAWISFNEIVLVPTASLALAGSGSFSGSFSGSGADLYNIPATAIVGLNLSQITSGSYSASISPSGLLVNNRVTAESFTGSLYGTASWANNALDSVSASYASSASYSQNAQSASYALVSISSSYATEATTASYAVNAVSSSYANTASYINTLNQNLTLVGNQIITGSLTITSNLSVLGSASITYVSESTLNIGTNLITVNTLNPSIRFGGLAVIDSGSSPQISGSFLFDSQKDQFIFVHESAPLTSSVFLLGPETYNNLGNEIYLTQNRLPKGSGIEHLYDSNISDDGSVVSINSNTQVTGSLVATGLTDGSGSNHVVMYNTASGQFFFTASSAIGGGGGNASNDNFQQIFLLMGG